MLDRRDTQDEVEDQAHIDQLSALALVSSGADAKDDASHSEPMTMARLSPSASTGLVQRSGRWTPDEKILFLYGLKRFGKGRWKKMSIYLPHRSLVQIKSHAQKVLKRLEAGENVFRRLEENYNVIDSLIVQAAKQRDALLNSSGTKNMSAAAKRKRTTKRSPATQLQQGTSTDFSQSNHQGNLASAESTPSDVDAGVIAAAALCQLSSLSC